MIAVFPKKTIYKFGGMSRTDEVLEYNVTSCGTDPLAELYAVRPPTTVKGNEAVPQIPNRKARRRMAAQQRKRDNL